MHGEKGGASPSLCALDQRRKYPKKHRGLHGQHSKRKYLQSSIGIRSWRSSNAHCSGADTAGEGVVWKRPGKL